MHAHVRPTNTLYDFLTFSYARCIFIVVVIPLPHLLPLTNHYIPIVTPPF